MVDGIARGLAGTRTFAPHRQLGELVEISNSGADKKLVEGQTTVGLLNFMDVYRNRHVTLAAVSAKTTVATPQLEACDLRRGDVVVTPTSESLDDLAHAAVVEEDLRDVVYSYHVMRLRPNQSVIEPGFVAHLLRSTPVQEQILRAATGITRFGLTRGKWGALRVPVPSLETQREIVRVLDRFTFLIAALEAELEARRRQYRFFREAVLSPKEGDEVRWISLQELLREPLSNGRSVQSGEGYPVLRLSALRGAVVDVTQYKRGGWSEEEGRRFRIEAGDILVARGNGTIELLAQACMVEESAEIAFPDTMIRIRPNLDIVSQRYLYYLWGTSAVRANIRRKAKATSGVWKVSQADLAGVVLPIPDMKVQELTVEALDRFDALVNSLSIGLPAEIAARRKQYEYYRDKLLTFEEPPA